MPGPLSGYRVIEIAGIGPGPFAAMMLADMCADVAAGPAEVDRRRRRRSLVDRLPDPQVGRHCRARDQQRHKTCQDEFLHAHPLFDLPPEPSLYIHGAQKSVTFGTQVIEIEKFHYR